MSFSRLHSAETPLYVVRNTCRQNALGILNSTVVWILLTVRMAWRNAVWFLFLFTLLSVHLFQRICCIESLAWVSTRSWVLLQTGSFKSPSRWGRSTLPHQIRALFDSDHAVGRQSDDVRILPTRFGALKFTFEEIGQQHRRGPYAM